jgi:hypothetical protein
MKINSYLLEAALKDYLKEYRKKKNLNEVQIVGHERKTRYKNWRNKE